MLQPTDQWKGATGCAFFFSLHLSCNFSNLSSVTTITKNLASVVCGTCTPPDGNKRERMRPHGTSSGKTTTSNPDAIANTGTTPTTAGRTQIPSVLTNGHKSVDSDSSNIGIKF